MILLIAFTTLLCMQMAPLADRDAVHWSCDRFPYLASFPRFAQHTMHPPCVGHASTSFQTSLSFTRHI